MITAGIDVGSNTVRLLIADVADGQINKVLCTQRGITRLGAGLNTTGRLSRESMDKTIALFQKFNESIAQYKVEKIFAAATSAVREASNSSEFIERAKAVGIPLMAISGAEEAKYTYLGVSSSMAHLPKSAVIYDIGGGSTEFIYIHNGEIVKDISVPVGVVKLADKYSFDRPSDLAVHTRCMADIREQLAGMMAVMREAGAHGELIGTAGTVTTVAAVELGITIYNPDIINKHILTKQGTAKQLDRLAPMTPQQRLELPGLEPGREDLTIPGMLLVLVIMELFGSDSSRVSDYGLREGLAVAAGMV